MAIAQNYRNMHIMSASPMQLVIMLYDECIRSLKEAEDAFKIETPSRFETINNNLLQAQDIITELVVSLDMEKGGEIANNLHRLYDFMVAHLSDANVNKKVKPIREVRLLMKELRDAWQQIANKEPQEDNATPEQPLNNTIAFSG